MAEVNEFQRSEFHLLLALQNGLGALALFGRNERNRILRPQAQVAGTLIRRQPEFDLRPIGGVPPVTRQNETLLMLGQIPTLKNVSFPRILVGAQVPCEVVCLCSAGLLCRISINRLRKTKIRAQRAALIFRTK
ncbi:MAG: hypothetical protein QOJ04_5430 [Caballeronia sp.]|nr:hypothetical protein [Caballeronia sp.]